MEMSPKRHVWLVYYAKQLALSRRIIFKQVTTDTALGGDVRSRANMVLSFSDTSSPFLAIEGIKKMGEKTKKDSRLTARSSSNQLIKTANSRAESINPGSSKLLHCSNWEADRRRPSFCRLSRKNSFQFGKESLERGSRKLPGANLGREASFCSSFELQAKRVEKCEQRRLRRKCEASKVSIEFREFSTPMVTTM